MTFCARGFLYDRPFKSTKTYLLDPETGELTPIRKKKPEKSVWDFENIDNI